ncbi:SCO family protein, partial [Synechococcus sp. MU1644]|nr:SCO family protein [Synechococcus sp. MU1644]
MTRIIAPVAAIVAALFMAGLWWVSQSGGEETAFAQCNATQVAGDGNGIG